MDELDRALAAAQERYEEQLRAEADRLPAGNYRAWIGTPALEGLAPAKEFRIVTPAGELARTKMDTAELKLAAQTARGRFYRFDAPDALLGDLPRGRQVRTESLPPQPIWNAPLLAILFVVVIGAEWILRKRVGLL